jgi:hypothetical protein
MSAGVSARLRDGAWWILVAFAVVLVLFGVTDVVGGVLADPGITQGLSGLTPAQLEAQGADGYRLFDFVTRGQGLALIVMGVLYASILLIPYRARQRWAWYAMWSLPGWSLSVLGLYLAFGIASDQPPPPPMVSGPITAAIAATILLVDRRRFVAANMVGSPTSHQPPGVEARR